MNVLACLLFAFAINTTTHEHAAEVDVDLLRDLARRPTVHATVAK